MKPRSMFLTIQIVLILAISTVSVRSESLSARPVAQLTAPVVQIDTPAGPWINLDAAQFLTTNSDIAAAQAGSHPLALTAADLDANGAPDIVAGYATDAGGLLILYRDPANGGAAQTFALPVAPDFVGAGDFNADGWPDIVAAARGGDVLWFLPGDGIGSLGAAESLALPGAVTALAAGEIGRQDGLADLAVGVTAAEGAQLLVWSGQHGAQTAIPEQYPLPAPLTAVAIGQLDGDYPYDLALAAGNELLIWHGRDQFVVDKTVPTLETWPLDFAPLSLALGDFLGGGDQTAEIALLGPDGQIRIVNSKLQTADGAPDLTFDFLRITHHVSHAARLFRLNTSSLPTDDLLVMDGTASQAQILTADGRQMTVDGLSAQAVGAGTLATLDLAVPVAAALPIELNGDALDDLALLADGAPAPMVIRTAAVHTFVVDVPYELGDDNPGNGKCEGTWVNGLKICTLRAAIQEANASAGADEIQLNIKRDAFYYGADIRPESNLPNITEAVRIVDVWPGQKQVIDGRNLPTQSIGLFIQAGSVVLEDLTFTNFVNSTIGNPVLKIGFGTLNIIRNCQVGPYNAAAAGIELVSNSNRIEDSVFTGNQVGVLVSYGDGNMIGPGNTIGFGLTGAGPTNETGIKVKGATNTHIGNPGVGNRNVIWGNHWGIQVDATETSGTSILGNNIGLNADGTQGAGNAIGIHIAGGAAATTIGNSVLSGRNLIGDNITGIHMYHAYGGAGVIIENNYIGVNANATAVIANLTYGIYVRAPSVVQIIDNVIGGSPTSDHGISLEWDVSRTLAHQIHGNIIGTDPGGALDWGHGQSGIYTNKISGMQITDNVIKNNGQDGIYIANGGTSTLTGNTVSLNDYYGIYASGNGHTISNNTTGWNGQTNIMIPGNNNTVNSNTSNNQIQSAQAGINIVGDGNTVRNLINAQVSGGYYGVLLDGDNNTLSGYTIRDAYIGVQVNGDDNVINLGNYIYSNIIGINIEGTAGGTQVSGNGLGVDGYGNAMSNYDASIVDAGANTVIGGSNAIDGNIISGGALYQAVGLLLSGGSGATVRNNKIGVGLDGTSPLGNAIGIHITGGTQSTIRDNLIAYNGTGILIAQGTRHAILGNSIHSNTTLGIDLSPTGVTLNDSGDGDSGANNLQNFPVITLAGIVGSATRVRATLNSTPSTAFTFRLYSSSTCDASGYGQGRTYLGEGTVSADAGGQATIDLTVNVATPQGYVLTLTASDPNGNTSEFSACSAPLGVLGAETLTVNTTGDATDTNTTDGICDSSATAGEQCTLRAAIQQANATSGVNTIILPAGTWSLTIAGADAVAAVGDLDVTDDLTISGAGANVAIVQGSMGDRIFDIRSSATVTITGVTIKGGSTANGGGVYVASTATLIADAVSVQENQATSGSGGGIYSEGSLTLSNSAVISNTAGAESNGGGGIYLWSGTATLRNTTVSGNQTNGNGGGIMNMLATSINLNNVTVAYNTADSDNDGGDGGGLYTNVNIFSIKNSIVAENLDLSHSPYRNGEADCHGEFTSQGYNLIGDRARASDYPATDDGCTGFDNNDSVGGFWLMSNYLAYAAGLGPLQLNGGATPNHSPYSVAAGLTVDLGNPATPGSGGDACEPFDQRGQPRPIDGGTDGVARCDRGAVEHIPSYLSIGNVTVAEGGTASFNVTLSTPAQITFTVQYSTTNITAVAGQDYTHVAGTLTFNVGQTSKTIQVSTLTDTRNEDTETLRVRLYRAQWVLVADGEGIGTLTDGSPQPALLIGDRTVTEGDAGGSAQAIFTVSLNSASGKTVMVDYATADGTALTGEDYAAAQGQLVFAPGVTSLNVAVNVTGDNLREGNETFTVQLSNPVNATIGDTTGQGTITDDDTPAFTIYDSFILEGDSGTSALVFIVELSKPSAQQATAQYATGPGTAAAGSDYLHTSGTLTFAAGETLKTVSVSIVGDEIDETSEVFYVSLSAPTGGATIARATATGSILEENGCRIYLPLVLRNVGP